MPVIPKKLWHYLKSGPALNLWAGYFCFASTAAYGLLSLPLAVRFLDKEHLGLWNLVTQIVGYLLWLDLGVSTMAGRTLAEPIAGGNQTEIDRTWSSILAILWTQGGIIVVVGILLLPFFLGFFHIPGPLVQDASFVFLGTVILNALNLPVRAIPGVFLCQDRLHWSMIVQGSLPWINLLGFWILLHAGLGIRSYVFSSALVNLAQFFWLRFLLGKGHLPPKFRSALVSFKTIRPILGYSSSMMLWGIAPAAIGSIPSVVIGRNLTLDHVSVYNVTSRIPIMVAGLALRTYHAFYPRLQKLFVTDDREKFAVIYRFSTMLSVWFSGGVLLVAVMLNPGMVTILARSDFYGGNLLSLIMATGLLFAAVAEHLGSLFYCAGRSRMVSLVLALEVAVTFTAASLLCKPFGLIGVAGAIAFTPALFRIPYFMAFGPRTCKFGLIELYSPALTGTLSVLLMGLGLYAILTTTPVYLKTPASISLIVGIVVGILSLRTGWRDFAKLR